MPNHISVLGRLLIGLQLSVYAVTSFCLALFLSSGYFLRHPSILHVVGFDVWKRRLFQVLNMFGVFVLLECLAFSLHKGDRKKRK